VNVRVALRTPVCAGVKVIGMALSAPGARLNAGTQPLGATVNSAAALEQTLATFSVLEPLLVTVTLVAPLVVAIF